MDGQTLLQRCEDASKKQRRKGPFSLATVSHSWLFYKFFFGDDDDDDDDNDDDDDDDNDVHDGDDDDDGRKVGSSVRVKWLISLSFLLPVTTNALIFIHSLIC